MLLGGLGGNPWSIGGAGAAACAVGDLLDVLAFRAAGEYLGVGCEAEADLCFGGLFRGGGCGIEPKDAERLCW